MTTKLEQAEEKFKELYEASKKQFMFHPSIIRSPFWKSVSGDFINRAGFMAPKPLEHFAKDAFRTFSEQNPDIAKFARDENNRESFKWHDFLYDPTHKKVFALKLAKDFLDTEEDLENKDVLIKDSFDQIEETFVREMCDLYARARNPKALHKDPVMIYFMRGGRPRQWETKTSAEMGIINTLLLGDTNRSRVTVLYWQTYSHYQSDADFSNGCRDYMTIRDMVPSLLHNFSPGNRFRKGIFDLRKIGVKYPVDKKDYTLYAKSELEQLKNERSNLTNTVKSFKTLVDLLNAKAHVVREEILVEL
jgi:hypothetical protein